MTAPVLARTFPSPALEAEVAGGLVSGEALLRSSVKSDYAFVTETSRHLVEAGGKRFRPLLVLLAAHLADPAAPPADTGPAVCRRLKEMIGEATQARFW